MINIKPVPAILLILFFWIMATIVLYLIGGVS